MCSLSQGTDALRASRESISSVRRHRAELSWTGVSPKPVHCVKGVYSEFRKLPSLGTGSPAPEPGQSPDTTDTYGKDLTVYTISASLLNSDYHDKIDFITTGLT